MAAKAYSAPLPLAAIYDTRLAGLDLRVLACIAFHDRMSLATGNGQGCWASHGTLAAEVGCNYINLGKSIKKLGELAYLERHAPTFGDKRGHVYRVPARLYAKDESLSFGKRGKEQSGSDDAEKVCHPANDVTELVCHDTQKNDDDSVTSSEQYISLSDVRYSAEAEEDTHLKVRAVPSRGAAEKAQFREGEPLHATLAKFERAWKRDWTTFQPNLTEWRDWLWDQSEQAVGIDNIASARAQRLAEQVDQWIDYSRWEQGEIDEVDL